MKVHLINPSEKEILENAGDRPPLGLLYIGKQLQQRGHRVKVHDMNHDTKTQVFGSLFDQEPHLVGVSCLTSPMVKESVRLLRDIKSMSPKSKTVVGGFHPSVMPQDFDGLADYVIRGEGEYKMAHLAEGGITPEEVTMSVNLDALGSPARDLVNMARYNMDMDGMRTATMLTSRGCPNACTFCGNLEHRVRYANIDDIETEVRQAKFKGYDAVYFMDDVFTVNKGRAAGIAMMMKRYDMPFRITTRANFMSPELANVLAENGCYTVSMGVESGDDEVLANCGKNQTTAQIRNAVRYLGQVGINTKGFFIFGLPGETEETAKRTLEFAEELKEYGMNKADFYPLQPYPGTAIWERPEDFGIKILDRDYTKYLQAGREEHVVPLETEGLSADRILAYTEMGELLWQE
jgi:radical SAM superfamily enzyme YgiQ (UPF0313 family)